MKVDVIVPITARLAPPGDIELVQSYTGGIIEKLFVTEGQLVEKGEVLVTINSDILNIDMSRIDKQDIILQDQIKVYLKLFDDENIKEIDIEDYGVDSQIYIRQILSMHDLYKSTLKQYELAVDNAKIEREIAEKMLEKYWSPDYDTQLLVIKQKESGETLAKENLKNCKLNYKSEISKAISTITDQLNTIYMEKEKTKLNKDYQHLVAPVTGYITKIENISAGSIINSATSLISMVFDELPTEVEGVVLNRDVADLDLNMEVEVKLDAYPFTDYGTIPGRITYISASSFNHKNLGSVYLVRAKIENTNPNLSLVSGLTGTMEAKIAQRSVLDYFLEPIKKGFATSLREK